MLGTEQTCSDILPIFEDYSTKDCDDVKIGTLTHLTEFFEVRNKINQYVWTRKRKA